MSLVSTAVVNVPCPVCRTPLVVSGMREAGQDILTKVCPTCGATIVHRKDPETGRTIVEEVRPN